MRFFAYILFIFLFGAAACKNKSQLPATVLPPETMQAVLWDLMRADHFLSNYVLPKDTSLKKIQEEIKIYNQILQLHHITESEFKSSLTYYKKNPALIVSMMDSLSKFAEAAPTKLAIPETPLDEPVGKNGDDSSATQKDTIIKPVRLRPVPVD